MNREFAEMNLERFTMRHLPNDTITVTVSDMESTTAFGDPGFTLDARAGNDTLTATILGGNSFVTLVGEDATLNGHSHGGNDSLAVNLDGFNSGAVLVGDAQSMSDHARGGNDTLHAEAKNSIFSGLELYGDAQNDMSGDARGWAALSSLIRDDSSGNAVVHLSANDTITLNGVHTAALHPADFLI
jgi:hypothetical protein